MKKFLVISVILIAVFFTSCEQFEQGGLKFEYSWSDAEGKAIEPPALDDLYAWAELTYKGEQKTTGPVAMADEDAALRFENLPYETGMVMKMTIRISEIKNKAPEARTDNVVYFCTSEEFELKRGKVTVVKNGCKMEPGPALSEDNKPSSPELKIVYSKGSNKIEVSSETEMKTPSNKVEVLFKAPNDLFNTVILANDTGFAIGKKEFPRPAKDEEGYYRISGYDLNEGLPVTNDGSRIVAIKLRNAEGFESLQSSITVFLDTSAPVLNVKNDASAYNGSGTVVVTVSSNETLKGKPVTGLWDSNSKLIGILTEEAEELQKGTSYRYQIPVMDNLTDGSYTIKVKGIDIVDNMSDELETEEFTVDSIAPELEGAPAITPERVAQDTEYTVTFKTKDDMSKGKVAVLRKEETLTCTSEGNDYTCKGTAPEGTGDSIDPVVISLTDEAGNLASFNAGNLIIDRTAPAVSGEATVIVTKPAGCPLSSVTAAIGGSSVEASFIVNEILAGDPVVRAVKDTDIIPLVLNSQIGYFYSFTAENIDTGSIADGTYEIEIELVDEAGNQSKTVSSSFNIITIKPAVPAVDVADTIIYRRIPWGSDATGGIKYYSIKAGANAVDANTSWVYAFDGSDPATASEIGKAQVTNKTFSEFELNRADRTEVYIAAYDNACNRSDAVKVRDVEWIATMGYKEPGDSFKNPHGFYTTGFMSPTLEQKSVALQEPFDGGSALTLQTGNSIWVQRTENTEEPPAGYSFAMVYDSIHGKTVLFGGYNSPAVDETWKWDGMLWSKADPIRKPSARSGHAMAYDSARGKVVLFGGAVGAEPSDETWEWDGTNWTQIDPETKPSARYYHAMTYDSARGKVVLFGGRAGSDYSDETWEWDGNDWIQMNPVNAPSARESHALVYDSAREKVVMFGGYTYSDESIYFDETWEWDGTDWIQLNPVYAPSARKSHTLAYDSVKEKIVLFGGYDGTANNNETWEWDGINWSQMNPVHKPSARSSHGMVFDKVAGKMFMFSETGGAKEMWEWDGSDWLYVNPVSIPSAGKLSAMAFDDAHGKMILFGGSSTSGSSSNETWEWGGANWTKLNPVTKPSARSGHAMAYDSVRDRIVMFGGFNNETWEWDGSDWTKRTPASSPSSRKYHAMAFDPMRGKVVLFGGYFNQYSCSMETWEWDGNNWTLRNPANSPAARFSHAMAYDGMTGRMLLFGGYNDTVRNNETWAWDGTNWTQLNPTTSPSARQGHTMAYNSNQLKTVLFGGAYGSYNNETWEWDGTNWNQYNPSNKPSTRYLHAMAYDTTREEILLFGGVAETSAIIDTETWRWRGDWVQVNKDASPAVRTGHTIVYDSAVKQTILFGGYTTTYNDETWSWNGSAWTQLNSNKKPSARQSYAMAYDSVREKVVLFGGLLNNETWEWDVTGWTRKYPVTSPSARWYSSMAYDFSTGNTVLFGGYYSNGSVTSVYNETWEWDGVNWSLKNPVNKPSNRSGHAMAYDISRSRLVLFGGSSGSDETWEWDGNDWTQLDPASKPPAQSSGRKMIYDISRNKVVVFGSEIWEWDGVDWTRCESVNKPTSLSDFSITYDELRNKSVLFGKTSLDKKDETWEWDSGGNDRAGQIMNVSWESAGITDNENIQSLSVLFNAGGLGDYTGTPYEGVDLLAWMHDRWETVSYNEAGPDALEPVTWETTDPVEIQTLLNSGLRKFNFAVVPTAPNGFLTDMGSIATDYAEVIVRYKISK